MALTFLTRVVLHVLVRIIFVTHSFLIVRYLVLSLSDSRLWGFVIINLIFVPELAVLIRVRNGESRRWVSPSSFIYTAISVPALCILKNHQLTQHYSNDTQLLGNTVNETNANDHAPNPNPHVFGVHFKHILPSNSANVLQQSVFWVFIFTRWIMPKGRITRDELSQLLFVYVAVASDILEILEVLDEPKVGHNKQLRDVILAVWGASFLQFSLVFNNSRTLMEHTRSKESTIDGIERNARKSKNPPKPKKRSYKLKAHKSKLKRTRKRSSVNSYKKVSTLELQQNNHATSSGWKSNLAEILGLLSTLLLMDIPYFVVRVYLAATEHVYTYNIIFFMIKNALVIVLSFYRFLAMCL